MTDTNVPRLPTQYTRPDLSGAEQLLGESLGPISNRPPGYQPATVSSDTSGIPRGKYCYDAESKNRTFCPYFSYTEIGMARCAYLNILAYTTVFEDEVAYVQTHFDSVEAAETAGFVNDEGLRDRYKVCRINEQMPGRATYLESLIKAYREEVESQPSIEAPTAEKPGWDFTEMTTWMIRSAWTRLELWEYMTGMVEDIPAELIHELMVADKRFRAKTFPAHELMDPDFATRMPPHREPKRQYWYMYRKNLGAPLARGTNIDSLPPSRREGDD